MEKKSNFIAEDLLELASSVVKCLKKVKKDPMSNLLVVQLLRSVSSVGANYEEACGAQSRRDFIHKLHISYKELRETKYWVQLLYKSEYISSEEINKLLMDIDRNLKIIARSLITAKKKNQ